MYRLYFHVHFHNSLYSNLSYSHVEQTVTKPLSHPRFVDFELDDATVIVVIIFSKQSTFAEILSWWILGNLGGIYRGQNTERRNGAGLARKRRSTK